MALEQIILFPLTGRFVTNAERDAAYIGAKLDAYAAMNANVTATSVKAKRAYVRKAKV